MPRKPKRRGYSTTARDQHPGVTVSRDRGLFTLRWRDVLPGGKQGKRRKKIVRDDERKPVTTLKAAREAAVAKSKDLAGDHTALKTSSRRSGKNPNATWEQLIQHHRERLVLKGRSPRTIEVYSEAWVFLGPDTWSRRPALPKLVLVDHLEEFTHAISSRKHRLTGEPVSPHYVASILRALKALLNHGRRRLACVRLSAEEITEGLEPPERSLQPVVLPTSKLCSILDQAAQYDATRENSLTFPLLACFMLMGCRRGELERLRWNPTKPGAKESWIDFEGKRLLIYGAKTKRQRTVPLENRPALREILELLLDRTDPEQQPFVFGGEQPLRISRKRSADESDERGRSLKRALYSIREQTGADWPLKSLRSTTASHLANSRLYSSEIQGLAWELGHDERVLRAHYAEQYHLPKKQARASSVEAVLGIADKINEWLKEQRGKGGRVLQLRGA